MNLIDLFWLVLFVGGGAAIGNSASGFFGAIAGGIIGYLLLYALASLNSWCLRQTPPCKCGSKDFENFTLEENEEWGYLHKCYLCNSTYIMRKGNTWDEISRNNQRIPFMKKGLNQKWRIVT